MQEAHIRHSAEAKHEMCLADVAASETPIGGLIRDPEHARSFAIGTHRTSSMADDAR